MNLRPVWTRPALKDLRRLDPATATRIREAVLRLAGEERGDVRRLQGRDREWRLRELVAALKQEE